MSKLSPFIASGISLILTASVFGDQTIVSGSQPAGSGDSKSAVSTAMAGPSETEKALAAESEAYCRSTASTKVTPQMIMDKVKEAGALLEKEGSNSLGKFQGKGSPFIFAGTYLWINDFDGVMLMHAMSPVMNGKNHLELKDKNGKFFFAEMIKICKGKGEGWIDYYWPKPGEKEPTLKVGYVRKARCDGKDVVVGCGVYDLTMADVEKTLAAKPTNTPEAKTAPASVKAKPASIE